jgi:hypothetical protein
MAGARILYVAQPVGFPSGGVSMLFRHVEILSSRGFDAYIYLLPGEGDLFVSHNARIIDATQPFEITPDDVFVIPEGWVLAYPQLLSSPARKYVFCQNHFYAFAGLGDAPSYAVLGIEGVIAVSNVIARFLEREFGTGPVPVVPCAIDTQLFRPRCKRRQIAFMPRKLGLEGDFMRDLFRRRHHAYADIPWVRIDKLPIETVAGLLGETSWFLSLSHLEGFGLPPLEAMACDALVAGFHGEGGLEYASRSNGFWCPTGDLDGCVAALARLVALTDAGLGETLLAGGRATVARYSREAQERALVEVWTAIVERRSHQSAHITR